MASLCGTSRSEQIVEPPCREAFPAVPHGGRIICLANVPALVEGLRNLVEDGHKCREHFVDAAKEKRTTFGSHCGGKFCGQRKARSGRVIFNVSGGGHAA